MNDDQKVDIKKEVGQYNKIIAEIDNCREELSATNETISDLDI